MRPRFRTLVLPIVAGLLVAAALPVAAGGDGYPTDTKADTVKMIVWVYYKTDSGKAPLPDVEVFAFVDGTPWYVCSNADGKAVFKDLPAGGHVAVMAMGPALGNAGCQNSAFLNPDSGEKMFTVFYDRHYGVRVIDAFDLPQTGKDTRKMVAKTTTKPNKLCMGMRTTPGHVGTRKADVIVGTAGDDVINARGGDDQVNAGDGNDWVCGGPGEDDLYGEAGFDDLYGEGQRDYLDGGADGDSLWGGKGWDTCTNGAVYFSCEDTP